MTDPISISKTLRIRDCGLDEFWLQDQIAANPGILGLGELELAHREKKQSSGGKLDLLLTDPEDDTMYEVEVMLGATDESHIIRTIEYWDLEKRRWPQRQHYAVLVAESVTRRFFNVIQLLSLSIPVIAIQANIIEADGKRILHFAKVLDAYEEPEIERDAASGPVDVNFWQEKAPSVVEAAKALLPIIQPHLPGIEMRHTKRYVGYYLGNNLCFGFHKRRGEQVSLWFWANDTVKPAICAKLEGEGMSNTGKGKHLSLTVDKKMIEANTALFTEIAKLVRKSWQL